MERTRFLLLSWQLKFLSERVTGRVDLQLYLTLICFLGLCWNSSVQLTLSEILICARMKINSIFLLLGASMASAWMSKSPTSRSPASLKLSTAVSSSSFTKPERVVLGELPTLYVYDHCPFCVRVRVALGVKNIKHNLHFLANDDIPTASGPVQLHQVASG